MTAAADNVAWELPPKRQMLTCVNSAVRGIAASSNGWLSDAESRQFWSERLTRQLIRMADPAISERERRRRSRTTGRVFAMLSINEETCARIMGEALFGLPYLPSLISQCIAGYRRVTAQVADALTDMVYESRSATTVADLFRGMLRHLSKMTGFVGSVLLIPDADGVFRTAGTSGRFTESNVARMLAIQPPPALVYSGSPEGDGPVGQAWRSEDVQISNDYQVDSDTAPWHTMAKRLSVRSAVAIPICDPKGRPSAVVTAYSSWPNYFAGWWRAKLIGVLRLLVEDALKKDMNPLDDLHPSTMTGREEHVASVYAGKIEFHFQPIVDLRTGQVVKFEGLARMRTESGLLPPGAFLPSLGTEELWRLLELGMDSSLSSIRDWDRAGLHVGVSANLPTSVELSRARADMLAGMISASKVSPNRITLEVLESGIGGDIPGYLSSLSYLRGLGVKISQDDLGTGHSSLSRLKTFEFDEVKVARELIQIRPGEQRGGLGFITATSALAKHLGAHTTVEGLETKGLLEASAFLGADRGQGYYLARPMPASDVLDWAAGLQLDLNPNAPTTPLGGLAVHMAWENRVSATAGDRRLMELAAEMPCPLDGFLSSQEAAYSPGACTTHRRIHEALRIGDEKAYNTEWRTLSEALQEPVD